MRGRLTSSTGSTQRTSWRSRRSDPTEQREHRRRWVVRLGDDLYIRSVNGRTGTWFRGAQDRHEARIQAAASGRTFSADRTGYERLLEWAGATGKIIAFGIEGTGSYGAGLTSAVRRRGHKVIEVARTDRRDRRLRGKNDLLDAHNAARAVLAGTASATPKTADGVMEMLRLVKVAKDTAVKARTSALITLKAWG
jgi:hypothetical protein